MKILFVVNSFPTISETFILAQIVGLIKRGHDIHIEADWPVELPAKFHADVERYALVSRTVYRPEMPKSWAARGLSALNRIRIWGWRRPFTIFELFNVIKYGRKALNLTVLHERLPATAQRRRYDIIHCHFGWNGRRALTMRNLGALEGPIVTTFHGYDANLLPRVEGLDLYKELFKHGELFTVGSEFMRERILSLGAPKTRIAKLPMGVDVSKFRATECWKRETGTFRLLTVARLVEVKGIGYALRAIALIRDEGLKLRYLIAGDGPLRAELEELAIRLDIAGIVQFRGRVTQEEAISLYERADAFLLPSIRTQSGEEENQPVVLAEAQASGLPVIATSIGGITESMRDRESGILVPPRNPEALASAILHIAQHPEEWGPMGRAGRRYVEKYFDLERLHDRLVATYELVAWRQRQESAMRKYTYHN